MSDQPPKKRQKSGDSTETKAATASTTNEPVEVAAEEEEETHENKLEQDIEQEEKKADNIVIRDLMGSVKPESNKKLSEDDRRAMYDNVYSKLLTLLERCQKYVHHLNNKVKQSIAEHQQKKLDTTDPMASSTDDDMKRTGLLKKYYDMKQKDIHARQPKSFIGSLKAYQLAGLEWLRTLHEVGLNAILADEMGLGERENDS